MILLSYSSLVSDSKFELKWYSGRAKINNSYFSILFKVIGEKIKWIVVLSCRVGVNCTSSFVTKWITIMINGCVKFKFYNKSMWIYEKGLWLSGDNLSSYISKDILLYIYIIISNMQ